MNRSKLIDLTKLRLEEAKILLENRCYAGAYYFLGYVVECGLKACIAKQTKLHDFPDLKTVQDSWTHDFMKLNKVAQLELDLKQECSNNQIFEVNWSIVKDWSIESRYQEYTKLETELLHNAITDKQHGVLKWIEQYW
jgi:HEPN domain-containing protein